jgi:hypothetical protein
MHFREYAESLRNLRIRTVTNPERAGFIFNNGSWLRVMQTELYYNIDEKMIPAGLIDMFYVDIDPNIKSPEAQLVKTGIWNSFEGGWLIANIKGDTVFLAKVTPAEKTDLDDGWITNDGILVLRRSK